MKKGDIQCGITEINSNSLLIIKKNSFTMTTLDVNIEITNDLNTKGIIKNYGKLTFNKEYSVHFNSEPTKCYEMISSITSFTFPKQHENIMLIENKLIQVCPTESIDNKILRDINIIYLFNTFAQSKKKQNSIEYIIVKVVLQNFYQITILLSLYYM